MKNYKSRDMIATDLGTTWRRVDQAIRDQGVEPCGCGLRYDHDEVREALGRMEACDAVRQKDATAAVVSLQERYGDEVLVRWARNFFQPLLRSAVR